MMKKVLAGLVLFTHISFALDVPLQRVEPILPLETFSISPYSNPYLPQYGLVTAIIETALDSVQIRMQVLFSSFLGALEAVKSSNTAGIFPVYKDDDIENNVILSAPILDFEIYHYEKSVSKMAAAMAGAAPPTASEGLPRVVCIANQFKNLVKDFVEVGKQAIYTEHPHECFQKLVNGEVQEVIDEKMNADLYGPIFFESGDLVKSDKPLVKSTYHLGISRNIPDAQTILETFNEGLKRARKHGKIQEIQNKFSVITKI